MLVAKHPKNSLNLNQLECYEDRWMNPCCHSESMAQKSHRHHQLEIRVFEVDAG
jgi:hypothetical protein